MSNQDWIDESLSKKRDELQRLLLQIDKPAFFPATLEEFVEWSDEGLGLRSFSRPIVYKKENEKLRLEVQNYMKIAEQRWNAASTSSTAAQLEALTKMLASRYHQERHARLDAEQKAAVLQTSVDSLTAKLREATGSQVRLVHTAASTRSST